MILNWVWPYKYWEPCNYVGGKLGRQDFHSIDFLHIRIGGLVVTEFESDIFYYKPGGDLGLADRWMCPFRTKGMHL